VQDHDDFDFEDSPGIPAPLPPGEHVVWQGQPDKWELARHAFHLRKVFVYFLLIIGFQVVSTLGAGGSDESAGAGLALTLLLTTIGLGLLGMLAWLTAHVTIYTVTNRRILIRFGVALQMTINLPFAQIKAADMRIGKNGSGDIPLVLKDTKRVNYLVLWPHVRPWHFSQPQPMLRGIPDVQKVAQIIATVAADHAAGQTDVRVRKLTSADPVGTTRPTTEPAIS
jgi:hypothetical protein